jgi:hypothetical protein
MIPEQFDFEKKFSISTLFSLSDAKRLVAQNHLQDLGEISNYYVFYSQENLVFFDLKVNLTLRFKAEKISSLEMNWIDGKIHKLGYMATSDDILKEKEILAMHFSKKFAALPSQETLGSTCFEASNRTFCVVADLKSSCCYIDVRFFDLID